MKTNRSSFLSHGPICMGVACLIASVACNPWKKSSKSNSPEVSPTSSSDVVVPSTPTPIPQITATPNPYPFTLAPDAKFHALAAGAYHTCALTSSGAVQCWGANSSGQLGNNASEDSKSLVNVLGLEKDVVAVTAGKNHSCALTTTSEVKCWGDGSKGQLGDGLYNSQLTPVKVVGLENNVVAISAAADHTCALTSSGGVKCWGEIAWGEVEKANLHKNSPIPADVPSLDSGVRAIAAGGDRSCALTTSGKVFCWGGSIEQTALEFSSLLGQKINFGPKEIENIKGDVKAIASGGKQNCALTSDGAVHCWGSNDVDQLGIRGDHNNTVDKAVLVWDLEVNIVSIASGKQFVCGLEKVSQESGGVKCLGNLYWPKVDAPNDAYDRGFKYVSGMESGLVTIAAGDEHLCGLTLSGNIKCMGSNHHKALGDFL